MGEDWRGSLRTTQILDKFRRFTGVQLVDLVVISGDWTFA